MHSPAGQDFEGAQLLKGVLTAKKFSKKGPARGAHTHSMHQLGGHGGVEAQRKSPNRANEQGGDKFQLGPFSAC